ncbi:MAG: hypothetical protein B7Z16_17110 [Algoriphagus sp. 32-45-6]|nr:MAG: hypothetical protein B7Z16_17110 [Algoriphagus sp. 32-45-6]
MKKEDISKIFLSDAEYTAWVAKWDSLQTGLFTPLSDSLQTLSIPGANGGVNWGSTATNPKKGMLYVIGMNYPSVYDKLRTLEAMEVMDRKSRTGRGDSKVYQQNCVMCHGNDGAGLVGPPLLNIGQNYNFNQFKALMSTGRADMPSFAYLKEEEVNEIYEFLTSIPTAGRQRNAVNNDTVKGPVVASGGAPGGLDTRQLSEAGNSKYGMPYPEGVKVGHERLYLRGWGLEFPYILNPPWSEIMAYDLNTGVLKWKRPLGEDLEAKKKGFENSGMLKGLANGMLVTSTGLVFANSKDGHIYAFDAENGEELWKSKLPSGSMGLPSMYEEQGIQFLVVPSAVPVQFGRGNEQNDGKDQEPAPQGGYVVYALPDRE